KDVIPYAQREGLMYMAYTPLERGQLARNAYLENIGRKYGKTAVQVALNWLICIDNVIPIPKAASIEHVKENAGAMGWRLSREDWLEISRVFGSR
ncbi:MAG: aldo/keto reductase, partial [Ignisphaera sp.]